MYMRRMSSRLDFLEMKRSDSTGISTYLSLHQTISILLISSNKEQFIGNRDVMLYVLLDTVGESFFQILCSLFIEVIYYTYVLLLCKLVNVLARYTTQLSHFRSMISVCLTS